MAMTIVTAATAATRRSRARRRCCGGPDGSAGRRHVMADSKPCTRRATSEYPAMTQATGSAWGVVSPARIRSRPSSAGSTDSTAECSARRNSSS